MIKSGWTTAAIAVGMFAAGFAARGQLASPVAYAQANQRVFELRTYTAHPGKYQAMQDRFRDHISRLFEKHGMTQIGYWTPMDPPLSENTFIYLLAHSSRETAKKSWDAFRSDPERAKIWAETEKEGPINLKVESIFLEPTSFSALK